MAHKPLGAESSTDPQCPVKQLSKLEVVQEALREVEEKCQAIINNIEDGYYEVDLDGNFTYFNDAMALITGFSRQELIRMNNRQIMDQYQTRQVSEIFKKVYHTGLAAKAIDWELIRKDGTSCIIEVSVSLKKNKNAQPIGFLGIARDITQRKKMEQALKESEHRYRTIIENIEDGYYEVDLAGNYIFFNSSMARITGYTHEEMMGMNYREYMDDYNAKQVFEVFNKTYQTGLSTKALDWKLIAKNGTTRFIEVSVTLKRDLNSQPIGFMGIARDVTDRRHYVETLEAREKELQTKTRNLEEVNTALKVLLERRDTDKAALEDTVIGNINDLVIPYLEKVKARTSDKKSQDCLSALENSLETITSSFFRRLTTKYANLTATEIEVANLVKNGKGIKEIADLLSISGKTVENHRMSIRKKMGIANTKTSLRSHLLSLA
ncbi:MAG: PAS domain S-box protein [Desulfobacterales bacterium]